MLARKVILFLVVLHILPQAFGQKGFVSLSIDPKQAQTGELLTIVVKSNVQGEIDIDYPSAYIQGYNLMSGMEQEMDYNTGQVNTIYYLSQTGVINKEGTYTFGPAYIKKGNRTYKSNTVVVKIGKTSKSVPEEITDAQLKNPAFGVIKKSKSKIYEGQSVLISAKVYAHFNPTNFENYQSYLFPNHIKDYPINSNARIIVEEDQYKGVDLYSFEHDKKLFFPNGVGKMIIEPFKLYLKQGFQSVGIISNKASIEVQPLPKPLPQSFYGGVGEYSISSKVSNENPKKGEAIVFTLTLKGIGNLHQIDVPKLHLPIGIKSYGDPKVKEDYTFTTEGADGSITYTYHLLVQDEKSIQFPVISWSYFSIEKEKYQVLKTNPFQINGQVSAQENNDLTAIQQEKNTIIQASNPKDDKNLHLTYYLGATVIVLGFGLLFLLFKNRKPHVEPQLKTIQEEIVPKTTVVLGDHPTMKEIEKYLKVHFAQITNQPVYMGLETLKIAQEKLKLSSEELHEISALMEQIDALQFGMGLSTADEQQLRDSFQHIKLRLDQYL